MGLNGSASLTYFHRAGFRCQVLGADHTGWFFFCCAQISVLKRKTLFNQRGSFLTENFMEQNLWLAAHRFSFGCWKLGGTVTKPTCRWHHHFRRVSRLPAPSLCHHVILLLRPNPVRVNGEKTGSLMNFQGALGRISIMMTLLLLESNYLYLSSMLPLK